MGYITSQLTDNEKVVFLTRQHWVTAIGLPALFFLLGGLMMWLGSYFESSVIGYIATGLFIIGALLFIRDLVLISCTEYGATNKRVIIKTGLIWRQTQEIMLQKVESIAVSQSIGGRVLGYGTIVITGSGGSNDPYKNIAQPLEFRRAVQEQIEAITKDHE